jgi:hypothetical protein
MNLRDQQGKNQQQSGKMAHQQKIDNIAACAAPGFNIHTKQNDLATAHEPVYVIQQV